MIFKYNRYIPVVMGALGMIKENTDIDIQKILENLSLSEIINYCVNEHCSLRKTFST